LPAGYLETAKKALSMLDAAAGFQSRAFGVGLDDEEEGDEDEYWDDEEEGYGWDEEEGFPLGPPDEQYFRDMLPPGMFDEAREKAAEAGVDLVDLFQRLARGEIDMEGIEDELGFSGPPPGGPPGGRRSRRRSSRS
jgi:hypothetical protein